MSRIQESFALSDTQLVPRGTAGYVVVLILAYVSVIGGHGGIISICGIFYRPAIRADAGADGSLQAPVAAFR